MRERSWPSDLWRGLLGFLERSRTWSGGRRRGPCIQGGVGILAPLLERIEGLGFRVLGWEWEEGLGEMERTMRAEGRGRLDWGGVGLESECGALDGGRVEEMKKAGCI